MPAAAGRTVSVSQGAVTLSVAGVFLVPYQVKPMPNWLTDADVRNKTATGYDVGFNLAAPANAEVDLIEVQSTGRESLL